MKTHSEVYGICGRKGHGKDTLAKKVQAINSKFRIVHFADDLKSMCGLIFGLSDFQLHDPVGKEQALESPLAMDGYLDDMCDVTGLQIAPKNLIAISPRQILQYFGTDYVRSVKDSYWVDRVLENIEKNGGSVLIPDTRFPNEALALRAIGAEIIKVVRVGKADDGNSQHASESEIDKIDPDHLYSFKNGQLDRMDQVASEMALNILGYSDEFDPRVRLEGLLKGFNRKFAEWSSEFGWGANIVPAYSSDGTKFYKLADMAPLPIQKPSPEKIQAHADTLEQALKEKMELTTVGSDSEPAFHTPDPHHEGDLL